MSDKARPRARERPRDGDLNALDGNRDRRRDPHHLKVRPRAPARAGAVASLRPAEWVVNTAPRVLPRPRDIPRKRYGYETVPRSPTDTHTSRGAMLYK